MSPVRIRTATVDDAAGVAALHVEGWEEFRPFVPAEVMATRTQARRTMEWHRRLEDPDPRFWTAVAEASGHLVGFVGVERLTAAAFGANSEIHHLFVTTEWRRHGVGRRLLAAAANWIAAIGAEPISLYSFTDNPHRVAYTQLGGEIVGERQSRWDGIVVPETCYLWPTAADLIAIALAGG